MSITYRFYDYFTGKYIDRNELPSDPKLGTIIKSEELHKNAMVFGMNQKDRRIGIGPCEIKAGFLSFEFSDGKFTCSRCGMSAGLGIKEAHNLTWQGEVWPHAFDLTRTFLLIKMLEENHSDICDLIAESS